MVASYLLWLRTFGVSRYIVALELLSGVVVVGIVAALVRRAQVRAVATILAAALVVWTVPAAWGRVPRGSDPLAVSIPAERMGAHELFVMIGIDPMSYIIPSLPSDARFVRVDSYLAAEALDPARPLGQEISSIVAGHEGPIYSLGHTDAAPAAERLRSIWA